MDTTAGRAAGSSRAGAPPLSPAGAGALRSWYLYDAAISVIDALMITFVFSTYLTSEAFGSPERTTQMLSRGTVVAAVVIALAAPMIGWLSDRSGRRSTGIAVFTGISVLCTAACFLVRPEEQLLVLGIALLSAANAAKELAVVDYYAALPSLATAESIGRVSGRGWAAGYIGSILATAFVLFGFVAPGFLGLPTDDALNVRAVALFCAAWCAVLAAPLVLGLRRHESRRPRPPAPRSGGGPAAPYREVLRMIGHLWREDRTALRFLLASAVFRDGLSAVFAFGGVIAAGTFGFGLSEVMVFAIAGNLVAGLGALLGGQLDDRLGPRAVIAGALVLVLVAGTPLLLLEGKAAFWVCGLLLCAAVGPAQASSRSYLGRLTAAGTEGALYGLYATTGRVVSFLAPLLFGVAIGVFGQQRFGILGILVVILLGLLLMRGLPARPRPGEALTTTASR
ncbi:MFS transporter [Kocuria palustris]|uniref:MFS transporter n=1 Tax=Kocuria palustris TaxID=71999 RepID=UPI00119CE7CA|nr:MFS transporter [Kocuria palustris]